MIRIKLTSIMVDDQNRAREFYTEVLGFTIKHDIPMGEANWLTLVSPENPDGVELLLEPLGHPAAAPFQKAIYDSGVPCTQLYTDNIQEEYLRLLDKGVTFKEAPKPMGPILYADFDDTCGNLIRLVQE